MMSAADPQRSYDFPESGGSTSPLSDRSSGRMPLAKARLALLVRHLYKKDFINATTETSSEIVASKLARFEKPTALTALSLVVFP